MVSPNPMELHRKHWPGFAGESELRAMFDPGSVGRKILYVPAATRVASSRQLAWVVV